MRMPFGKHKGREIRDIPDDYLLWVLEHIETLSPYLREEIERALDIERDDALPVSGKIAAEIVGVWYRKMAREFHPDHGGNHEGMKAINRGHEVLQQLIGNDR